MVRPYAVFANPPGDDEIFVILFENFENVCQGTFELCVSMFIFYKNVTIGIQILKVQF